MGWVTDRITQVAKRVASTATDLPLQRAITLHVEELHDLVGIGVSLGRLAEGLALEGVVGARTGQPVAPRLVGRMLAKALRHPVKSAIRPPPDSNLPVSPNAARVQPRPAPAGMPGASRAGRGLESLASRKPQKKQAG